MAVMTLAKKESGQTMHLVPPQCTTGRLSTVVSCGGAVPSAGEVARRCCAVVTTLMRSRFPLRPQTALWISPPLSYLRTIATNWHGTVQGKNKARRQPEPPSRTNGQRRNGDCQHVYSRRAPHTSVEYRRRWDGRRPCSPDRMVDSMGLWGLAPTETSPATGCLVGSANRGVPSRGRQYVPLLFGTSAALAPRVAPNRETVSPLQVGVLWLGPERGGGHAQHLSGREFGHVWEMPIYRELRILCMRAIGLALLLGRNLSEIPK